ncbi:hypothetical protein WJX72_002795 [[Myrmecia] bisecta]|uniref:Uncharacterized protein n=1 Tax=[Myrmecia] bisecta TaxID=41462 RepID=A0AAW1PB74_9CHLO
MVTSRRSSGLEGEPLKFLKASEAYWTAMRKGPSKRGPAVVKTRHRKLGQVDYDVCVCGGTLGLFIALALQLRGHRVCIIEKRLCQGRTQEWNISRQELQVLVRLGLVTEAELRTAISSEFNPVRVGFKGGEDIWVDDCLNLGVNPKYLLDVLRERFLSVGGAIRERTAFRSAEIFTDGIAIKTATNPETMPITAGDAGNVVSCRLLVDCMGHWSPIVKQLRGGTKPQGMCLVVGTCADGFPEDKNRTGDLLYTMTDAAEDMQLFWEAFPAAGGGRTTYMFTYADADQRRLSLEQLLDRYFELLPQYQGVPLSDLKFRRVLFGGFPCYEDSPLKPGFDRVVQVGDASASQSPLSFGGFGNMVRHIQRLTDGLDNALREDQLSKRALTLMQPYQPSLSAAWLFQRSMAFRIGQVREKRVSGSGRQASKETGWLPADHVNRLLRCNFRVLRLLGDRALRPFLQDTIQWGPLTASMAGMMLTDPLVVCRVLVQVGPKVLLGWFKHYFFLGAYSLLHLLTKPLRGLVNSYRLLRWMDAWKWGSGQDYGYHKPRKAERETAAQAQDSPVQHVRTASA